jgi:hypothetical protein
MGLEPAVHAKSNLGGKPLVLELARGNELEVVSRVLVGEISHIAEQTEPAVEFVTGVEINVPPRTIEGLTNWGLRFGLLPETVWFSWLTTSRGTRLPKLGRPMPVE